MDDRIVFGEYGDEGHIAKMHARPRLKLKREELVNLLNKGTHFDDMLEALKDTVGFCRFGFGRIESNNERAEFLEDIIAKVQGEQDG